MGNMTVYWVFLVIFWLSVMIIFYTYALFPLIISILAKNKPQNKKAYKQGDDLPSLSILISAYNEEMVIEEKIESIFNTNYPLDLIEVLIGSDSSTDNTNNILNRLSRKYSSLHFFPFKNRSGKGNVINTLYEKAQGEILVLTDANVMLDKNTLFELVKYFKDEHVGLTDTRMINTNIHKTGISYQEKAYISREVSIKHNESILWGTMMGPFGGCFAIRRELYTRVPENFLVDDFYINMKVLEKGYRCINNIHAQVYERVPNALKEEFLRKKRIATGNFQNLKVFSHLIFSKQKGLSFCFISHKVLRWISPFFLLLAFVTNILLATVSIFYFYLLLAHCALLFLPLIDFILRKFNVNISVLRFVTHFYAMNIALGGGFIKSLKPIETNVWNRTKRS